MAPLDLDFITFFGEESQTLEDELFSSIPLWEKEFIEVEEPTSKRMRLSSIGNTNEYDGELFAMNKLAFENATVYNGLEMRSTRFSMIISLEVAINMFTQFCAEMGMTIKQRSPCKFLITYAPEMSLMADVIEFSNGSETRVVLDCRRSRGCGLAFKRAFKIIKEKMQSVIYSDDDEWMRNAGLIRQN